MCSSDLDNSDILAEAVAGNGGYINITPVRDRITVLQDFDSRISADSEEGNAGEVNIESPNTDISALVAEQNANVMEVPTLASSPCDVSAEDTSRLTGRGEGQVRPPPEGHLNITSLETLSGESAGVQAESEVTLAVSECLNTLGGAGDE